MGSGWDLVPQWAFRWASAITVTHPGLVLQPWALEVLRQTQGSGRRPTH